VGRLLRGTFKLAVIGGVIGGGVAVGKKLMGGLGPEPGSADAPGEWPSLVPDPVTADAAAGNGTATPVAGASPADTAAATITEVEEPDTAVGTPGTADPAAGEPAGEVAAETVPVEMAPSSPLLDEPPTETALVTPVLDDAPGGTTPAAEPGLITEVPPADRAKD
jgi:hypothetical protein